MDWSNLLRNLSPDEIMRKYGEGWAVAYFLGLCFLAGSLFLLFCLFISRANHRRRKNRRSEWGYPYGLRLLDTWEKDRSLFGHGHTDIGSKILREYPYYNMFKESMAMASNILDGTIDGMPCRVFDFSYTTGSGKYMVTHQYSVVAFHYDRIKPHTALRRHAWRDGLSKEDILTGREEFDDKFYIYADAWELLKNELPQEIERTIIDGLTYDLFLADKALLVVARGRLRDKGFTDLFADARQLATFFQSKV